MTGTPQAEMAVRQRVRMKAPEQGHVLALEPGLELERVAALERELARAVVVEQDLYAQQDSIVPMLPKVRRVPDGTLMRVVFFAALILALGLAQAAEQALAQDLVLEILATQAHFACRKLFALRMGYPSQGDHVV